MRQRNCPACLGAQQVSLHRQSFVRPGLDQSISYDVVACPDCGCAYATNLPDVTASADYYAGASHHLHAAGLPQGLAEIHEQFFTHITQHAREIETGSAIIDIGAGAGHFLHRFQVRGFTDLTGLDAARAAGAEAARLYGIPVLSTDIAEFVPVREYDLACLCGVLEHLAEPGRVLEAVARRLRPDGLLFVAVPDADQFSKGERIEPFQEFALEHINFFSRASLDRLLGRHGLIPVSYESRYNGFYRNHTLMGLYRKQAQYDGHAPSFSSWQALQDYIAYSRRRLTELEARLRTQIDSGEPIVVWGVGELTMRLLATSRLREANIVGFVDSHPRFHGKRLLGIPVHAPEWLSGQGDVTVWVMSYVYAGEIRAQASHLLSASSWVFTLPDG